MLADARASSGMQQQIGVVAVVAELLRGSATDAPAMPAVPAVILQTAVPSRTVLDCSMHYSAVQQPDDCVAPVRTQMLACATSAGTC
jgi:hypothetical protein